MLVMYLSSASVYSGDVGNKTVCYQGAFQCFSCILILSPVVGLWPAEARWEGKQNRWCPLAQHTAGTADGWSGLVRRGMPSVQQVQ